MNLLSFARISNVNIFLKQFKMEPGRIVELIKKGDESKIGDDKLKGLLNILPFKYEVWLVAWYSFYINNTFTHFNLHSNPYI